jgi:hypothetical protein
MRSSRSEMPLAGSDVVYVNMQDRIIYTTCDTLVGQDVNEFNRLLLQAKKAISDRPYILDRFEMWELGPDFNKAIRLTLMSRARSETERQIVKQYINTLET